VRHLNVRSSSPTAATATVKLNLKTWCLAFTVEAPPDAQVAPPRPPGRPAISHFSGIDDLHVVPSPGRSTRVTCIVAIRCRKREKKTIPSAPPPAPDRQPPTPVVAPKGREHGLPRCQRPSSLKNYGSRPAPKRPIFGRTRHAIPTSQARRCGCAAAPRL